MPKTSSETSTPIRVQLGIGAIQEIGDHVLTLQLGMLSGNRNCASAWLPSAGKRT